MFTQRFAYMCVARESGVCVRGPGSKEHSCVLAGDMLIATDINLKNISRSNMCLRLHLQPSEQRGTARAHTNTHSRGKSGSGKTSKRISETACHLRCPQKTTDWTACRNIKAQIWKLWSRLKHRRDYSIKQMCPLFFTARLNTESF